VQFTLFQKHAYQSQGDAIETFGYAVFHLSSKSTEDRAKEAEKQRRANRELQTPEAI